MSNHELSDRYQPTEVEARLYPWWEEKGYFKAEDQSTKPPFSVILPPPNVTGALHLGHALDHTIQDVLIRWKRMSGYNAMWMPGTDHAGIATQMVVEKQLRKDGVKRQDLGREKFVEKVWEWKHQYGNRIYDQMRRLGDSCDWERATFTLDEDVSKAVRKVFVSLFKRGMIYRGTRLINWSCPLETAISDLEVEHRETKGNLWHLKYPLEDGSGHVVVATTRPETMLGDAAICVHPEDQRYEKLVGKKVKLPLLGRLIPIIADEYVDKEFGSGALKITPAHDFNDYAIGNRHDLEFINILNKNGTLNENAGEFAGLKVLDARKKVVEELESLGLVEKVEPHKHSVGYCSRSGAAVEPLLSAQWFVKVESLAGPAKRVVESGTTAFEPASWTKTYLHWMNILEDWCVSRQLWWGHRIPAWRCSDCEEFTVAEEDPTHCESCQGTNLLQEEDVLDTWFSSALWPFSTMGWPEETETQKTFYPTSVLVTGHDIIFFWVARMMMMGLEFKQDVPFRKIYIHGLVRDSQGRKMSKSLGNSVDPVELMDKYGADALRFTILAQLVPGRDFKFSQQRLEGYRNFMNKIWNAARFSLKVLDGFQAPSEGANALPVKADTSLYDQWITFRLGEVEREVQDQFNQMRFSDVANTLYKFVWNDFCDWYLEFIKPIVYGENGGEKAATQLVLAQTLNRIMRLLHPIIPYITEEIYQKLPIRGEAVIIEEYPTEEKDKVWLSVGSAEEAFEMEVVKSVIDAIRNIRGENRISPSEKISVRLAPREDFSQKVVSANKTAIMTLAGLSECLVGEAGSLSKCAVSPVVMKDVQVDVIVPLEGLVDIGEEIKRLTKAIEKLEKDVAIISKKLSNEKFVENAPAEIIEADRLLLGQNQNQIKSLQESLLRLK